MLKCLRTGLLFAKYMFHGYMIFVNKQCVKGKDIQPHRVSHFSLNGFSFHFYPRFAQIS